jgi:hypothetical protein
VEPGFRQAVGKATVVERSASTCDIERGVSRGPDGFDDVSPLDWIDLWLVVISRPKKLRDNTDTQIRTVSTYGRKHTARGLISGPACP